ncbi:SDR family oxidoreductase [bacterium]|nr:MAG: SDR family oxidoreductase [bacterium]
MSRGGPAPADSRRSSDPDLGGRVAVVTGGGRGLGRTLARRYAAAGAAVVLAGRGREALEETAGAIQSAGGQAEWVVADVTSVQDVDAVVARAKRAFGHLDVLVNNAGIPGPTVELERLSLEEWQEVMAVNLTGVFLCCRAAIPLMREAGGGRIINIGSVSGKRPLPGRTPYAASKLGLIGLTRTLAHEVGKHGINVNAISPWLVAGDRLDLVIGRAAAAAGVDSDSVRAEWTALSPFGRGVTEDDVANVALFLTSAAAENMTGQDINVTAGAVMY